MGSEKKTISYMFLFGILISCTASPNTTAKKLPSMPLVTLQVGSKKAQIWYAEKPHEAALGLRYRQLKAGQGMLIPATAKRISMDKMRSPIDVALIDKHATIIGLWQLSLDSPDRALPPQTHYIWEMSQGWFQQRKIIAGMSVVGLPMLSKGKR